MLLHVSIERLFQYERTMIGALGVISAVVGTAFAYMASQHPRHQQVMETFGGVLLIVGFTLLGCSLEYIFTHPNCCQ
jgi:membrane associated rhomboid family serine protease